MKKMLVLLVVILFLVGCTNDDDRYVDGSYSDTIFLTAGTWINFYTMGNTFSLDIVNDEGERHPMAGTGLTGRFRAGILVDSEYTITITGNGRFRLNWE